MSGNSPKEQIKQNGTSELDALARLAKIEAEISRQSKNAAQQDVHATLRHYETTIGKISQGVCYFDGERRLILANGRYAELYGLQASDILPGTTLRKITEARIKAGTCTMPLEEYLAWCETVNARDGAQHWTIELKDGRTIQILHQPMPDHGWVATHEDITELKAKRAAATERLSLQTLVDLVPDYLWVKDKDSKFLVANKALAADWGFDDPSKMIGRDDYEQHPLDVADEFRRCELEVMNTGKPMIDREEFVLNASGSDKWILTTKVALRNSNNEIDGVVGISKDITERKRFELVRSGQAELLEMIATSAPLDDVLLRLVRLVESQVSGIRCSILLLDSDGLHLKHAAAPSLPQSYIDAVNGTRIGPKVGSCGTAVYRREPVNVSDIANDPLWENYRDLAAVHDLRSCWSTPILSHQGRVLGTFAMYSSTCREPAASDEDMIDISTRIAGIAIERKQAEDRIRHMANHDALTGLPNRALLTDRLSQAVSMARRHDSWVAVTFLDLDNFKTINDSLGHNAGDELLKTVAQRMKACVRSTDTVVRLGGDEFVIVMVDLPKNPNIILEKLQRIKSSISETIQLESHDIKVSSSMGVAIYPNDGSDVDTLLANADAAMYRVKEQGRDSIQFFVPDMSTKVQGKLKLQQDLRNALIRNEFTLLYQPQADLQTGKIFAVEALIRWNHPELGLVTPDKFIPIAEEIGLIVAMGDWVLHEACRQNKAWQDAGLPPMSVSVNVSPRQFKEKTLVRRVIHALSESGLDAKYLELEITESLIMRDIEQAVQTMQELANLGIQISIDDFGTGYSSLSALKTFPVARLKIDRSFISNLANSNSDKAVTCAVISLGQKLNLKVIAEGVETKEQVTFLRANNCDEIQGYFLSRPISSDAITVLMESRPKVET
ncbi:MAG: EAL domain-containing protein [Aestuariivirga sp.]